MNYYDSLKQYYKNGCVLHPGKPPVWGEVGYKQYMQDKIVDEGIKQGDVIRVTVKWPSGKSTTYTGIVLYIYDERIHMLSQGAKVWKDKKNLQDIVIKYVTEIEKVKDAEPEFDITKADPYSVPVDKEAINLSMKNIENKREIACRKRIESCFPKIDIKRSKILWLLFDFYWMYDNGTVEEPDIFIINKDGSSVPIPAYKNKHIYPNKCYYTACGIESADKEEGGILLFFDSIETIENIKMITSLWTVDLDGKEAKFLIVIYPEFKNGCGNIYNIVCRAADMQLYEESLHFQSVFSGQMEKEYDKAFLYIIDNKGDQL